MTMQEIMNKYPYLRVSDNSVEPWRATDSCWLEDNPKGWHDYLLSKFDELNEILKSYDYFDKFEICQMKEKYGEICIYHNSLPAEVYDAIAPLINEMERTTANLCCVCGKPATQHTSGWVLPYCDECYTEKTSNRKR